jgi:hypothetical protein
VIRLRKNPGAFVDPACPIDWSHPLNVGLVAELVPVPNSGWGGGLTLRDLTRGGRTPGDGTLTNGPTWAGSAGFKGSYRTLLLDGTNDKIDSSAAKYDLTTSAVTLIARFQFASSRLTFNQYFIAGKTRSSSPFAGYWLRANGSPLQAGIATGGSFTGANGAATISNGVQYDGGFVYDGAALQVYLNGKPDGSSAAASGALNTVANAFSIGGTFGGDLAFPGLIGGVSVWSRALSAAEVAAIYAESRRGNPERFRWIGTRVWSIPAATTPATPVLNDLEHQPGFQPIMCM